MAGYNPDDFQRVHDVEDQHFWFVARNRVLAAVLGTMSLGTSTPHGRPEGLHYSGFLRPSILEVGCGTGNTLRVLRAAFPAATVVGVDALSAGLAFARQRAGGWLVQARIEQLPFRSPFDLVAAFDVLEHVEDDAAALGHLRTMLRPGGILIMTVPARRALWSRVDEESHHWRRYEPRQLRDTLTSSGFRLEYQTYFMMGIYPLAWIARRIYARRGRASGRGNGPRPALARELRVVPGLNGSLLRLLAFEAAWIARHRQLPFGTSLLAVARS